MRVEIRSGVGGAKDAYLLLSSRDLGRVSVFQGVPRVKLWTLVWASSPAPIRKAEWSLQHGGHGALGL